MTTKHLQHRDHFTAAPAEGEYRLVSLVGALLYAQVVFGVALFFVVSSTAAASTRGNMLATSIFMPLFISIPATAVLYLLTVVAFLFQSKVTNKREHWAIQVTVVVALLAMLYCVWWASRAFLS